MNTNLSAFEANAKSLLVLSLVWGASAPVWSDAVRLVVPISLEGIEGDSPMSSFEFPNGTRIQEVYPSTAFASLPSSHRWLSGFAYRPDAGLPGPKTFTAAQYQIIVSTTDKTSLTLSDVFAENTGDDAGVVFQGPLTVHSENLGPASGPREFDILFEFDAPFYYDPGLGNLLLEQIRGPGNNFVGFDHHSQFGETLVGALDSSAAVAGGRLTGTVTQFIFVPEPASVGLLVVVGVSVLMLTLVPRQWSNTK